VRSSPRTARTSEGHDPGTLPSARRDLGRGRGRGSPTFSTDEIDRFLQLLLAQSRIEASRALLDLGTGRTGPERRPQRVGASLAQLPGCFLGAALPRGFHLASQIDWDHNHLREWETGIHASRQDNTSGKELLARSRNSASILSPPVDTPTGVAPEERMKWRRAFSSG